MNQIYQSITCWKCGNVVSGVYCPMCGAKLQNVSEALVRQMSRGGGTWARRKKYPTFATPCYLLAKDIKEKQYPDMRLKEVCTEKDVEEIMASADKLYEMVAAVVESQLQTSQQ